MIAWARAGEVDIETETRRIIVAGHAALVIGIGLGRFAYTPMIPILVADGVSPAAAAYLGAANFVGYMVGALVAARLSMRLGATRLVKGAMLAGIASLAGSALSLDPIAMLPWRVLAGLSGGVLMVGASTTALGRLAPERRPLAGGLIYAGIGVGTAIPSLLLGPAAAWGGARGAWIVLTLLGLLALAIGWRGWTPRAPATVAAPAAPGSTSQAPIGPAPSPRRRAGGVAVLLLVALAYACDGAGFTPHSLFWVDYVARELSLGLGQGSFGWLMFGIGAAVGPIIVGAVAGRIGTARTLILAFAVKAAAVALALVPTAFVLSPVTRALSPLLVGGLSPGLAALVTVRLTELTGGGPAQARIWGRLTFALGIMQAGGGFAFARILQVTGSYRPVFMAGAVLETLGLLFAWASARRDRPRRNERAAAETRPATQDFSQCTKPRVD